MKGIFAIICIAAIGVVTLGAAPTTILVGYDTVAPEVQKKTLLGLPDIMGPKNVVVGELARLEVEGDKVAWDCIPTINDGQSFGENNQKYVCSFRKEGLYTIVAAVYRDDQVKIMKFPIQVGETEPSEPNEPVVPIEPTIPVINPDLELVKEVVQWCKDTSSDKAQCQLVADVFDIVSNEIEDGELNTTSEIIDRTAELNRDIEISDLASLMGKLQAYLTQEADAGRLETVEQHLIVWKSIQEGLAKYAKL